MILGEGESRSPQENITLTAAGRGLVVAFDDHVMLEDGFQGAGHPESLLAPPLRVVRVSKHFCLDDALVTAANVIEGKG